jgi:hypothetical protein
VATNLTGLPISTGVSGLGSGVATLLATPSSANLASAITDETGSGSLVFATSPTLVTPILGTPTSGTLTNATGLPISTGVSGLGTGVATFLATPSSANLAAALTDETGSGANVFATSPTLVTPILGTPTSATLTNATGLPLSTGVTGTLPVANGGTGTATPSIVAGTNVTVTGTWPNQTIAASGGGGSPGGSTTQVQYNNAGAFGGITGATTNGTALTLVAPVLGTPASATLTNATGLPLSTGVTGTLPVANGGTGQTTYTDGQLLIGNSTGNTLTKATLTAGTNVTITNAAGAITIAASGGGGGGTPGGSTTQVQYNNAGAFGGISGVTTDGTRITHSTTLSVGGATPSTSGAGITFPATASDSSSANTLDDYEEGTWTPVWAFSTSGSAPLTVQYATYTKIGRSVNLSARFYTTSISSPTGNASITGIPFTSSSQIAGVVGEALRFATSIANLRVNSEPSSSSLFLSTNTTDSANLSFLTGSNFNSGSVQNIINISVSYVV